jgi:hypothetical protein
MPVMKFIEPNPDFKPAADQKRDYDLVKKRGSVLVSFVSALESVANSKGMVRIAEDKAAPAPAATISLEDMSIIDLKVMFASMGGKTDKQIKRPEVISWIRQKLDAFEILDDEG